MNQNLAPIASIAARLLLTTIFLMSALNKITNFGGTTGYMESKGMPAASLLLVGAIAFLFVGGLSVLLGYKARIGAVLLIVFLIPATLIFHNFWAVPEAEAQGQMIHFMKNLGLIGAMLHIAANGSGAGSLDSRRSAA